MSIKQNAYSDGLPDFRNLGVTARILVAVNLLALGAACYAESTWMRAIERFASEAAFIEPVLLASFVVLHSISPMLASMRYLTACALVLVITLGLAGAFMNAVHSAITPTGEAPALARVLVLTAVVVIGLLGYLRLRAKAYS